MITVKIEFKCALCGQDKDFYVMPIKKRAGDSYINAKQFYEIQCKKCNKTHFFRYIIEA